MIFVVAHITHNGWDLPDPFFFYFLQTMGTKKITNYLLLGAHCVLCICANFSTADWSKDPFYCLDSYFQWNNILTHFEAPPLHQDLVKSKHYKSSSFKYFNNRKKKRSGTSKISLSLSSKFKPETKGSWR